MKWVILLVLIMSSTVSATEYITPTTVYSECRSPRLAFDSDQSMIISWQQVDDYKALKVILIDLVVNDLTFDLTLTYENEFRDNVREVFADIVMTFELTPVDQESTDIALNNLIRCVSNLNRILQ